MKKFIILMIFFTFFLYINNSNNNELSVMSMNDNNINNYILLFDNENLNFRNFKLKMASFTNYEYNILRVYVDYPEKIKDYFNKEYFLFDNSNFNDGLNKIINEYKTILENNYLYDELDKDINETKIKRVDLYTNEDALNKFKDKYPGVIIKKKYSN